MDDYTPLLMFGPDRTVTLDGHTYTTIGYAGFLGVDIWHEFRAMRRDDGTLWTLVDEGTVGKFPDEPQGTLIEARTVDDLITRAEDYSDMTGVDVSDLCVSLRAPAPLRAVSL